MNQQLYTGADPAVIEHNINQTRAHVDRVLHALQIKLSPTELRAQAARFVKERSSELAQRLEERVRENPWPYVAGVIAAVAVIALLRHRRAGASGSGTARAQRGLLSNPTAPRAR